MMTVSQVSKVFQVSTRMLRHYEKLELIQSCRKEEYAYRMYDETAVRRLQQIMILRKLRIPLKQIALILNDTKQEEALAIFMASISQLNEEMNALGFIRDILSAFVLRLEKSIGNSTYFDLLEDSELMEIACTLSPTKLNIKEAYSMDELSSAHHIVSKKIDPRMVVIPACTVAAYYFIGENPEQTAADVMDKFVRESKLYEIKPDARLFGFNHPNPSEQSAEYGYEEWVTIPEEMEVPSPLLKKQFEGGLYAAHTINFPDFHEWQLLTEWAENNPNYALNYSDLGDEVMDGCLEEHLNWVYSSHHGWPENGLDGKIDLLIPVKKK